MLKDKNDLEKGVKDSTSIEENPTQISTDLSSGRVEQKGLDRKIQREKKHRKTCWLCRQGKLVVDYKEVEFLKNYLKRYNKILIHKFSGNCLKHQHQLSQAIKRARYMALLPFVAE